jgi:hypothetical protein
MSLAFGYESGYGVNSSRPLPPPVTCKVCGSGFQSGGASFDLIEDLESEAADDVSKCPECVGREKIAKINSLKLEFAKKSMDVNTPATFAQFEELINISRKIEENSRSIRSAIWGIWWGIFGIWAFACIGYFIVGFN